MRKVKILRLRKFLFNPFLSSRESMTLIRGSTRKMKLNRFAKIFTHEVNLLNLYSRIKDMTTV